MKRKSDAIIQLYTRASEENQQSSQKYSSALPLKPIWPNVRQRNNPRCHVTIHSLQFNQTPLSWNQESTKLLTNQIWITTYQNWEVREGPVGQWASSSPMLWKKSPVRLFPLMTGILDGASQPIRPNPMTLKSVRSQFLSKLVSWKDNHQVRGRKTKWFYKNWRTSLDVILTKWTFHLKPLCGLKDSL